MRMTLTHAVLLVLAVAGCSRVAPPEPLPPSPTSFDIGATNELVQAADLPTAPATRQVRADFNLDSLPDIAVAEKDAQGRSIVTVYLRRAATRDLREEYVRAGGIHQSGDYTISALMSSSGPGYTDLITMFNYADGSKEMVHFRSHGPTFEEVERQSTPPPAPTPKP